VVWRLIRRHLRSDGTAIQPYTVVHIIIGAAMNREMMSQAEADEEILMLDVSDDLLERAGSVEKMPSLGYIALTAIITASGRSSI
jgi:hypothetical protein